MKPLQKLNLLSKEEAQRAFYQCCSSSAWTKHMAQARPFKSEEQLMVGAEKFWDQCGVEDCMEAFSHHPRIGGDLENLRKWASQEQGGVAGASEQVLQALSEGNTAYENKFGFVFLICATGKSAAEMLDALRVRLPHSRDQEIEIAKAEQGKITQIRLKKLLGEIK